MTIGAFTTPITAAGTNQATATPIVRNTNWTIVMVTVGTGQPGIQLFSNGDVGDIVEIHVVIGGGEPLIWPESGAQINGGGANNADAGFNVLYRRVSAGNWQTISKGG